MPSPRRFDHDEARRRHAAGESSAGIARDLGVTMNAVWQIVTQKGREAQIRAQAAYYERHRVPCEMCGEAALDLGISGKRNHNTDGRVLCVACRGRARRERFRFDKTGALVEVRCQILDCANGERWQPPENFTRGSDFHDLREGGIHGECRACQTRSRRLYRQSHPEARKRENAKRMARYYRERA